jgi:quinoprotein dehydrogenase-associated probable ABC transporter substrate-binding protein
MSLRFLKKQSFVPTLMLLWAAFTISSSTADDKPLLRIAADPNNLPFSNERLEGFENKIASIIANEMGADIQYIWHAQRRGFFRETLKEGRCDLVMSVPAGFDMALTTRPYYRSSYVFVYPRGKELSLSSLDDPRLRSERVGIQLVGNDGVDTPPAHALARRGIVTNVVGFTLYGDYREENPPARIVESVAKGDVDIAVVWGPLAGYFAKKSSVPLEIVPVTPASDPPLRYAFNIAMGVRKQDKALRARLNEILDRKQHEIDAILADYGVPCLPVEKRGERTERRD